VESRRGGEGGGVGRGGVDDIEWEEGGRGKERELTGGGGGGEGGIEEEGGGRLGD